MSGSSDQQSISSTALPTREKVPPSPPDTSQNVVNGPLKSLPQPSNGSITSAVAPLGRSKTAEQSRPPPVTKKPTMTSRISGMFRRDTTDGMKDTRDKALETKKDASVQQPQVNGKIVAAAPGAPASSAAST